MRGTSAPLAPQRRLSIYASVVCICAALLLVAVADFPDLPQIARAFLFAGVAAAAQLRPMHLASGLKVTADDAATFAAALTLGPFLSALVAGGSALAALPRARGAASLWLFNAATSTLSTGSASLVFGALSPDGITSQSVPAILAAAATKYGLDSALVDSAVALQLRRDPLASWWRIHRRDLVVHTVLYTLGVIAAVLSMSTPWLILLFALPTLLAMRIVAQSARLSSATREAVLDLADRVDASDPFTRDHSKRTAALAERVARRMRLDDAQVELIWLAARVHDIGKVETDDELLLKPGPLEAHELAEMRRHADIGAKLLSRYPEFWEGAAIVLSHHERPDGTGYPRRLSGAALPLEVAVVAVADAYDAMTNDRPYRRALTWAQVRAELLRHAGTQWDARAVYTLVELLDEEKLGAAPVTASSAAPAAVTAQSASSPQIR